MSVVDFGGMGVVARPPTPPRKRQGDVQGPCIFWPARKPYISVDMICHNLSSISISNDDIAADGACGKVNSISPKTHGVNLSECFHDT